jgi:RND family efflux transporter MFP subunit
MIRRALLLGATATLAACGQADTAITKPTGPVPVQVATVQAAGGINRTLSGTIVARIETPVGFRTAGKIANRRVDRGDRVERGSELARLDLDDVSLALRAADADAAAARAASVQASADEARVRQLLAQGHVAQAAYDRAKAAADAAAERYRAARANASLARNREGYAVLRADAAGVITAVMAEPGQVVAAGQPVVMLARAGEREAQVDVPESMAAGLRLGQAASVTLVSSGQSVPATLRELSPQADPVGRTFRARFQLGDAPAGVALGQTVSVALGKANGEQAGFVVPLSAVLTTPAGSQVWRVDARTGSLAAVPVWVLRYASETATVRGGLQPGERIVSMGVHKLNATTKVRVVDRRVDLATGQAG